VRQGKGFGLDLAGLLVVASEQGWRLWEYFLYLMPDPNWTLYYLSSISMLSEWKKLKESTCRAILVAGPGLENWGPEPSRAILRHQMTFFGVKSFST
jgi:hypothetical protein